MRVDLGLGCAMLLDWSASDIRRIANKFGYVDTDNYGIDDLISYAYVSNLSMDTINAVAKNIFEHTYVADIRDIYREIFSVIKFCIIRE